MLVERGLEREGNRSVFWKGQDQNLLGHRLALVSDGPWSASHLSMFGLAYGLSHGSYERVTASISDRSKKLKVALLASSTFLSSPPS